jgi:hypothetical protein
MIALAAIPAPMVSCSSIWFPLVSWGLAALSLLSVTSAGDIWPAPRRAALRPGLATLNRPGLWIKPTGFRGVFVLSSVITYGKVLLSAKSECLSRWGVKMKTVIKVKELRDLAAAMKIDLVVTKNGGGVIVINCDSEIQLQKFVQTLEIALIQVSIDSPTQAYVFARAFADAK